MKTKFADGFAAVAAAVAALAGTAFGAAATKEGGTYTYTGSPNDNRTTGQTGDQTYMVESPISVNNFWPGQTDIVPYWQIYAGAAITATGNDRVMKGNVVFENAVKWTGTENQIGLTGPAKLVLRNGGSLTVTTEHLRIGQKHSSTDYPNTAGTVFMEEPSALTMVGGNVIAGNTRPGTIWMDGGTLSVTNGIFKTGGTAGQDGYIRINGGTVSLGSGDADFLNIGSADNYGSLHLSGGSLSTRRTAAAGAVYCAKLGLTTSKAADVYVDGGLLDLWNERFGIGWWNASGVSGGRASLTVDGDGRIVAHTLSIGPNGSGNTGVVNLNGGRLELTKQFTAHNGSVNNTGNAKVINFDGGTLALVRHSRTPGDIGGINTTGEKVVYPGDATIEVPSGISANSTATFRKATGWGVSEITLTSAGSGYVTAPKVTISGGSGSGATAYAVLNKDRTLEKIVVTCRGEGYAEGDAVTVAISSATGSGAAATATLAPNAGGVIRKTGAGTLVQTTNDNAFDGDVEVAEGSLKLDGAGFPNASLKVASGATLLAAKDASASLGTLVATNGILELKADGSSGTASLGIGALSVNQGLALVTHTNGLALSLSSTDSTATSSSASPVVNGLVYAHKDASAYRSPSLFERAADGTLSLVATNATPGPDANWSPSGGTHAVDSVNSIVLPLSPGADCYVENAGLVEIKSGMFICRRPHEGLIRMQVTGGGAFTTRAKDGMFIYGDNYEIGKRSNSTANGSAVNFGDWRRLFGPFADPDASTPMALTIAGEKQSRPELGAQVWLLGNQSFSGGLNLVNGGVFIQGDSGLGAGGSPVRASGYCSIAAYQTAFDITAGHPIELLDGSALVFSPALGSGNIVASALSGSGDLLASDVNRPACAVAFTGDHSAFAGDYYIQGRAQIAPATFSPLAGICLADGTNGVGVIETSGAFTRPAGTGKGEIRWKRFAAYPSGYGLRGGFSAFGGDLSVNLGGEGAKLVPGSDCLPGGAVVQLQSSASDGALTFANGFELGGAVQKVSVWPGKTATLSGAVSDSLGGGTLAVDGDVSFAGRIEAGAANVAAAVANDGSAPLVAVDGDLTFANGATIAIDAAAFDGGAMAGFEQTGLPIATATGTISGLPELEADGAPEGWHIVSRGGSLLLKRMQPFLMIVR